MLIECARAMPRPPGPHSSQDRARDMAGSCEYVNWNKLMLLLLFLLAYAFVRPVNALFFSAQLNCSLGKLCS